MRLVTGGVTWDYAGQQTLTDWTAATQAVTGDLRKVDSTLTGDALDRAAEQHITELCAQQPTHTPARSDLSAPEACELLVASGPAHLHQLGLGR